MTREEAIRYLIKPVATSTEIGEEKKKEFEAYNMAIEALEMQDLCAEMLESAKDTNVLAKNLISRVDAIDALMVWEEKSIWNEECLKHRGEPYWEAPSDVIEQLPSAEPCDKDAISREGLLKSWEELSPRGRTEFDQVIMTIPALPSADIPTGEWVWSDEDASWKCGRCDCVFEEIDWKPNYNFCPNCGAKMERR